MNYSVKHLRSRTCSLIIDLIDAARLGPASALRACEKGAKLGKSQQATLGGSLVEVRKLGLGQC